MALIRSLEDDRVKNLKSLSYGSNAPLVVKDINKNPSPQGIGLQASRRVDDLTRIAKYFISPSGLKFIGNQALLQQVGLGDKIRKAKENGKTLGGAILQQLGKTALSTGQLVASTLAQVPVNGTGTHFFQGFRRDNGTYLNNLPSLKQPNVSTSGVESQLLGQSTAGQSLSNTLGKNVTTITDFRKNYSTDNENVNNRIFSFDYNSTLIRREDRVNLGDQGKPRQFHDPTRGYTQLIEGPEVDKVNMLPPLDLTPDGKDTGEGQNKTFKEQLGIGNARDLIKFRFEVVTPEDATMLYFRAFLDTFNDQYNGDWSKNNYLGRGEAFYNYDGFDRNVQLGFKIAAATRHEMQPLYQKIVFLASSTAPTYGKNFMRGTLVKLTVGDYLKDMPGFIESISYNWNQDYPWEIAMSRPEGTADEDMQELPHVLEVSVNFTPIHRFTPQTGLYHYITNPGATGTNLFFDRNNETKPLPADQALNPMIPKLFSSEQEETILNRVDEGVAEAEQEQLNEEFSELDDFLASENP